MALSVSPAARHQLNLLLTAFSLGTLCFIRRWYDLEHLQPHGLDYFRAVPADSTLLISTTLASLILAAVFRLAWFWVERHPTPGCRKFAHCGFMLVLIFPIESVRRYWITQTDGFDWGSNLALGAIVCILAAGFVAVLLGNTRVLNPARRVAVLLTLLFPALLLDFEMNRVSAEPAAMFAPRNPLPLLPSRGPHAPRFIWLLFDEMDQRLAFERRPAGLELPELDRLASGVCGRHSRDSNGHVYRDRAAVSAVRPGVYECTGNRRQYADADAGGIQRTRFMACREQRL